MNIDIIKFLQSERGQKLLSFGQTYSKIEDRIQALRKQNTLLSEKDFSQIKYHTDSDFSNEVAAISLQISLREKAKTKFMNASQMLFDREGLEQSTNEVVSAYTAKRYQKFNTIADLTCGIGGDALSLAGNNELFIVDLLPEKVMLCKHNLRVYEKKCIPLVTNIEKWFPKADAYFIDPARRCGDKRVFYLEDSSPGIETIQKIIARSNYVGIKASPGLNYDYLPFECEIEVICHDGECKEIMLWCGDFQATKRKATLLPQNISLEYTPDEDVEISSLKSFIYEPHKAATRAHLIHVLAQQHNLSLLDSKLSYLTGDEYVDSPWLKSYKILHVMPFSEKKVKAFIRQQNIDVSFFRCRGFWGDEPFWRKRLQIKKNDKKTKQKMTLFLTRIQEQATAIFTETI